MTHALQRALDELGIVERKPPPAPVNRTPRDVSWFKRGEECPH